LQLLNYFGNAVMLTYIIRNQQWCTYDFYRVMLCIAWTMPSQDIRPSVRLFVRHTPVLFRNDYTYPRTFFTVI